MKGFVYVLSNASIPGNLKIGFSTKHPEARASELSGASVPVPYQVEYAIIVDDPKNIEELFHIYLKDYHVGKEFFKISVSDAIKKIESYLADENITVHYRESAIYIDKEDSEYDKSGYIYILSHPKTPNLLKIGGINILPPEWMLSSSFQSNSYNKSYDLEYYAYFNDMHSALATIRSNIAEQKAGKDMYSIKISDAYKSIGECHFQHKVIFTNPTIEKIIKEDEEIKLKQQRQAEFERQRQAELERQHEEEAQRQQAELKRQRQAELDRQRQAELKRQRQIELDRQYHAKLFGYIQAEFEKHGQSLSEHKIKNYIEKSPESLKIISYIERREDLKSMINAMEIFARGIGAKERMEMYKKELDEINRSVSIMVVNCIAQYNEINREKKKINY